MKTYAVFLSQIMFLTGCSGEDIGISAQISPAPIRSSTNLEIVDKPKNDRDVSRTITIPSSSGVLMAIIDENESAKILNYPSEWRGKIRMVRYDGGTVDDERPFSKSFCQRMGVTSGSKYGKMLVRGAYQTSLIFDIPDFLPNSFLIAVQDAARRVGIAMNAPQISNRIDEDAGQIELTLSDSAMVHKIGDIDTLIEYLNFSRFGIERVGKSEGRILINAGDLMCDLISGAATIAMRYPIIGEDRTIKLVYDKMTVDL